MYGYGYYVVIEPTQRFSYNLFGAVTCNWTRELDQNRKRYHNLP